MPLLLLGIGALGLCAVVAGNLIYAHVRPRVPDPPLAFTGAGALTESLSRSGPSLVGPASRRRPRRAARRGLQWRWPSDAFWLFAATFALYVALGAVLALHFGSIEGDAASRVAEAWYVLFSRDPHLAAVGFVWGPLPSVIYLPLVALKGVWPALTQRAFAANIVSAAFMAGAVVQLRGTLRDMNARAGLTWVLVVVFALNPMTLFYAANGMSEAIGLFFLVVAVRYLMRWLQTRAIISLVWCGTALALAYLARYEEIAAICAAGAVVAVASYARAVGTRKERLQTTSTDVIVYSVPPLAALIGWAVVSYVITGQAFQYLAANSADVTLNQSNFTAAKLGMPKVVFGGIQLLSFAPLLPLLVVGAIYVGIKRGDQRVAALLLPAAVLFFNLFALASGSAFPWLRFYLPVLPISLISIAFMLGGMGKNIPSRGVSLAAGAFIAFLGALLAVPGIPTTALAMSNRKLGSGEVVYLQWVLNGGHPVDADQAANKELLPSVEKLTRKIDDRKLPSGSIVADTVTLCIQMAVVRSNHPHQFIISSDRDFQRVLDDPPTFHAHYLLVPPNDSSGSSNAVNQQYPGLYNGSEDFARLAAQYALPGCPTLRLYKVIFSPVGAPASEAVR